MAASQLVQSSNDRVLKFKSDGADRAVEWARPQRGKTIPMHRPCSKKLMLIKTCSNIKLFITDNLHGSSFTTDDGHNHTPLVKA